MKTSVIIPAYNEEKFLAACLQSLMEQKEKADEIIVVDNNSTDKTVAIAKQFPVRIIHEKRQGITYARNRGFDEAQYDILLRTDADSRVPKNWVKQAKKDFASKTVIAVSGPAHFYDVTADDAMPLVDWPHKILFFKLLKQVLGHDCLFGPNMAIRRTAWNKVRDEVCLEDGMVHEDIDLSIHLIHYGKIKFDNKLIVNSSFRKFKKFAPYYEYPYRSLKTVRRHNKIVLEAKGRRLVRRIISTNKTLLRQLHLPADQ